MPARDAGLAPPERNRLVAMLGMLGSAHDGEVAAAGRQIDRFVRSRGLSWGELLPPALPAPGRPSHRPAQPDAFSADLALCNRHILTLPAREQRFVANMITWRAVTDRQRAFLRDIASRLRAEGAR